MLVQNLYENITQSARGVDTAEQKKKEEKKESKEGKEKKKKKKRERERDGERE